MLLARLRSLCVVMCDARQSFSGFVVVVVVVVNAFFDGNFDSKWVAVPGCHVFLYVRKIIFYIRCTWARTMKRSTPTPQDPSYRHRALNLGAVL